MRPLAGLRTLQVRRLRRFCLDRSAFHFFQSFSVGQSKHLRCCQIPWLQRGTLLLHQVTTSTITFFYWRLFFLFDWYDMISCLNLLFFSSDLTLRFQHFAPGCCFRFSRAARGVNYWSPLCSVEGNCLLLIMFYTFCQSSWEWDRFVLRTGPMTRWLFWHVSMNKVFCAVTILRDIQIRYHNLPQMLFFRNKFSIYVR